MLFTLKSFFHCFSNIKNDRALFIIMNVLFFKISFLIFIKIFIIIFVFKFDLHLFFKKKLIFLTNVVIIIFISFLSINVIIFSFFIDILIIVVIEYFIKYNIYNNLNFFLIISIDLFYLKYQLDKFLLNLYI